MKNSDADAAIIKLLEAARSIQDGRYRASVLKELITHCPENLLPEVLKAARSIKDGDDRASVLIEFMPHCPENLLPQLLKFARSIQNGFYRANVLKELIPRCHENLLPEVLEAAGSAEDGFCRSYVLRELIPHCPENLLLEVLEVARSIQVLHERADVLKELIPHCPENLLPEVLKAARSIQDGRYRANVLKELTLYFPEIWTEVLEASGSAEDGYERADVLKKLIPHCPENLLLQLLEVARSIQDGRYRANVLKKLIPHCPENLLPEVLKVARSIQDGRYRANVLKELTLYFPEIWTEVLEASGSAEDGYSRASVIKELIPYFPENLFPEVLEVARSIEEYYRVSVIKELIPHCPENLLPEVLETARSIQNGSYRADVLKKFIPHFPEIWTEVLETARSIQDKSELARLITSLLPCMSSECLPELLELARSIEDIEARENRIQALRRLEQNSHRNLYFDREDRRYRFYEINRIDEQFCQSPRARANALSSLFFLAEERERAQIFEEMLAAMEEIPDEFSKAESLLELAPYLPNKEHKQALAKVLIMIGRVMDDQWFEPVEIYATSLPLLLLRKLVPLKGDIHLLRFQLIRTVGPSSDTIPLKLEPEAVPRYFNTLFEDSQEQIIPADKPLIYNHLYNLAINIGSQPTGIGEELVFHNALSDVWKEGTETLPLTVIAMSQDFEILQENVKILNLPRKGSSNWLKFLVKPKLENLGSGTINILLIYRGHLIQSKQITAIIIPNAEVKIENCNPQTAKLTFAITSRINPGDLDLLPERIVSIAVAKSNQNNSNSKNIELCLLDRTKGDEKLAFYKNTLTENSLGNLIKNVRNKLLLTIVGKEENKIRGFQWILDGSNQVISENKAQSLLDYWLLELATVGYTLYLELLSPLSSNSENQQSKLTLEPNTIIQVSPILGSVTIPWAMVYERPLVTLPGLNHVCNQFENHDLNCSNCPNANDIYTVCPHSFWGYRYSIEQLPCSIEQLPCGQGKSDSSQITPLIIKIKNEKNKNLEINFNVYKGFSLWEGHINKIKEQSNVAFSISGQVKELFEVWKNKSSMIDLLYFYCHGEDKDGKPSLKLNDFSIDRDSLNAFIQHERINWLHHPLVFLNACGTGSYGPDSYGSLIQLFLSTNACGVIGTECPVPELFAEAYASELLLRLFGGAPLGQAMLEVRREFLYKKKNPLGLVYSFYAGHEVALTHPVSKEKLT
ncbi:MAG: hypothetical protein V6D39_03235 [Dolichospermum lemmermannii FEM_B0920]